MNRVETLRNTVINNLNDIKDKAIRKMIDYAYKNTKLSDNFAAELWDEIKGMVEIDDKDVHNLTRKAFIEAVGNIKDELIHIKTQRDAFSTFSNLWDNFLQVLSRIFGCKLDYVSKAVDEKVKQRYDTFIDKVNARDTSSTVQNIK